MKIWRKRLTHLLTHLINDKAVYRTAGYTGSVNNYRSYRQISTIGEMDCPTSKRLNSPFTQNPFRILERFLSTNWYLDATFSTWPQVSMMFKKKFVWKPINWTQIFNCGPKRLKTPLKKKKKKTSIRYLWARKVDIHNNIFGWWRGSRM